MTRKLDTLNGLIGAQTPERFDGCPAAFRYERPSPLAPSDAGHKSALRTGLLRAETTHAE
ncbi:hypothetical protein GCM10009799_43010 [Nocardiopsis rhodophaea]|uniref:Uncharacterized protein n=1 Tax=Nocardiopsis rhodophaea TaxID=280238 RepID=A0ABN2TJP2_9ACTN